MTRKTDAERVLNRLVDEARRKATPEVEWDALESSLLSRVANEKILGAPRSRKTWLPWGAMALAAVIVSVLFAFRGGLLSRPADSAPPIAILEAPRTPDVRANVDGNALATGTAVTAASLPIVVEHKGRAEWTLEPNGAAHVEGVGPVVTIGLDRGALSAHVVKNPRPESFVVIVERTRIAVHGTAFRVERLPNGVRVDVTEGVVGIGPVGATRAFELFAAESATVNFDGVRIDRGLMGAAPAHAPAPQAGTPHTAQAAVPEVSSASEEPPVRAAEPAVSATEAPPKESHRADIDQVVRAIRRCFAEDTVAGGDLRVTVMTHMSLHVEVDGRIVEAVFSPPLAPTVRECVDAAAAKLTLAHSAEGMSVERTLELER